MLIVKYEIIDGCSYCSSDKEYIKTFENENALNAYIDNMNNAMYEIRIINKKEVKNDEKE